MTRPKMTGQCSVQQFWSEVAHFGWGTKTTDYRAIKREMLERYDDKFLTSFHDVYREMEGNLHGRVEKWEEENGQSSECGDDGFGDLISHCVGLGDQNYALCMENPGLVAERGRRHEYTEKFSYGIPHAPTAPEESLEEAIEHILEDRKRNRACWEEEEEEDHPDEILMEALQRTLGDRAYKDLRFYGAWARSQKAGLEELLDSEFGVEFGGDLTMVVSAFTDVSKNEVEPMLPQVADVLAALERLEEKRKEIKEAFEQRLAPLGAFSYWGCRNMLGDIQSNFGKPEEGDE